MGVRSCLRITLSSIRGWHPPSPPAPRSFRINKIRGAGGKIFESKGLTGKIRKTKEIAPEDRSPTGTFPPNYGAVIGLLSQEQIRQFRVRFHNGNRDNWRPQVRERTLRTNLGKEISASRRKF